MAQLSDQGLLERYAASGDRDALGLLFRRHACGAYGVAMRVCRNSADAEDAVQAAFVKVMANAGSYRGGSEHGVKVWLMKTVIGTAKNRIRGEVRRRRREEDSANDSPLEELPPWEGEDTDLGDRLKDVENALRELPVHFRDAVLLHHFHGVPRKEAAEALDISQSVFDNRLHRGLIILRSRLASRQVYASAGAVVAVLANLPDAPAPASLLKGIDGILAGTVGTGTSMAGGSYGLAGSWILKLASVVIAVAGAAAIFAYARPGKAPVSQVLQRQEQPGSPGVNYHWNFNTSSDTNDIKLLSGSLWYVPAGGLDGSGCIETGPDVTWFMVDVPVDNLPVVVSYRTACVLPQPKDKYLVRVFWSANGPVAQLSGIGDISALVPRGAMSAWEEFNEYVTESYIDTWRTGNSSSRTSFSIMQRMPGARLVLVLRGGHRLEDLSIRSIPPEKLPDASQYLAAVSGIPPAKREGTVRLSQLKPGRDFKEVTVSFHPASR